MLLPVTSHLVTTWMLMLGGCSSGCNRHAVQGRPHAYVSCCRSLKLRGLLSSVVAQLTQGGKRKRAQAFAAVAGTEHSLIWELKGQHRSSRL
jgi:hypothetical protein